MPMARARGGSFAATARATAHGRRADPVEEFCRTRARFPVRVWRDDAVHARLAALLFSLLSSPPGRPTDTAALVFK